MGLDPVKTSAESDAAAGSIPDYFYSAASVIQNDRYRWFMEDLDRVDAELREKRATSASLRLQLAIKRSIDAVGSFVLIVLLAPVFLLTAAAVKG